MSGERFAIRRCSVCGLGHTDPLPADPSAYYPPTYHGGRHGITARWAVRRRLRLLTAAARGERGTLVDAGCGDGDFLAAAVEDGWQVAGTELSPDLARGRGLRVERDLDALADLGPVDAVTMWHSLEHMARPRTTVEAAVRLLRPGGVLVVAVPDADGWQARVTGRHWLHLDVPRHLYHFGPASLSSQLSSTGLELTRTWHQEFEYDAVGWAQGLLNRVTRRPNTFFDTISGRPSGTRREQLAALAGGGTLTALATPVVWAGAAAGHGGTLIVAARKPR